MSEKSKTGKIGEGLACKYLISKGYKIIERNHRQKWGEIDVITLDPEGVFVFVEVKTINSFNPQISPEHQMTFDKINKFKRVSEVYAFNLLEKSIKEFNFRLDVIAINLNGNNCRIKHYKNIS